MKYPVTAPLPPVPTPSPGDVAAVLRRYWSNEAQTLTPQRGEAGIPLTVGGQAMHAALAVGHNALLRSAWQQQLGECCERIVRDHIKGLDGPAFGGQVRCLFHSVERVKRHEQFTRAALDIAQLRQWLCYFRQCGFGVVAAEVSPYIDLREAQHTLREASIARAFNAYAPSLIDQGEAGILPSDWLLPAVIRP